MAMPLDYSRARLSHPLREVTPIIDATDTIGAIGQIFDFMLRHQGFKVGVPDTSFFPFSAICRLNLTFPSGQYHGTGFYIRDDLILTCGHNLFDKAPGGGTEACTAITVRVGQKDSATWLDSFDLTAPDFTAHPTWVASGATDQGWDLGILRVKNPPPRTEYFELINYSPSPETPIAVCGYGGEDVDGARQHLDIDRIRAVTNNLENVDYNLQTRRGNSGSPVFAHFTNSGGDMPQTIPVMGVHVASESGQLNRGVLLTPDKIDWALGGGISSVSAFSLSRGYGRGFSSLGGLPLVRGSRNSIGGLPLGPRREQLMLRTQSWARPMDRAWIVIDQTDKGGMSVAKRTFGHPTHDLSGKTTLSVRVPNNMPAGGSVRWNVPDDEYKARVIFETGGSTSHSTSGTTVTLRSLAGGPVAVDCMVKDASGTTVESNKYWLGSPTFILVSVHDTVNTFFDGIGMTSRRRAIIDEMKATIRHLYRNVNVRFVFPGDALPAHLGVGNNAAFPGGVEALPTVQYAEVIGADTVLNPETGAPYRATQHGQAHPTGLMPGAMAGHALARGLIHHFAATRPEIGHVQAEAAAGRLSAAEMDLAATMYGRLMGENLGHEVGHFLANTIVEHTGGDLMETGSGRTTRERTGMTVQATAPVLTDHGRAAVNELPADVLRTFEDFLPVNPPIDQAGVRVRGKVGSFSMGRGPARGWINQPAGRTLSDTTIHLPGPYILDGWKARAFVTALETAVLGVPGAVLSGLLGRYGFVETILEGCDRFGITVAIGDSFSWGLGAGYGAGAGVVFAPGHRIGFFGSGNGSVGWIYSLSGSVQITLINGGPELLSGDGYVASVDVATIGWFMQDTADIPVSFHTVFDANKNPIGVSFGVGISTGIPLISRIEAYGQATKTATTFGQRTRGQSLSALPNSEAYEAAVQEAIANGASRDQAEAFLAPLFA